MNRIYLLQKQIYEVDLNFSAVNGCFILIRNGFSDVFLIFFEG